LNEIWDAAKLYVKIDSAASKNAEIKVAYNPEMAALAPVVRGQMLLMIEVNRAEDIEGAIKCGGK